MITKLRTDLKRLQKLTKFYRMRISVNFAISLVIKDFMAPAFKDFQVWTMFFLLLAISLKNFLAVLVLVHAEEALHSKEAIFSKKLPFHFTNQLGTEREITFTNKVLCDVCEGNGAAPGTNRLPCIACGGSGQITQRQGFFVLQTTCPHCRGAGSRIEKPCDECRGAGRVRKKKKLNVKIPPGIEDEMRLVLRGEGEAGVSGGPSGD